MASGSNNDDADPSSVETTNPKKMQQFTGSLTSSPPLPTLAFDLIAEILCRLPVKLLLQLRCLCKSFNSLISDRKSPKNIVGYYFKVIGRIYFSFIFVGYYFKSNRKIYFSCIFVGYYFKGNRQDLFFMHIRRLRFQR